LESVARAVSATVPALLGVQLMVKGLEVTVPMSVAPARKSTLVMVAVPLAATFAVIGTVEFNPTTAPALGLKIETVGAPGATVTETVGEVEVMPAESRTCAVSATVVELDGVLHETENGPDGPATGEPI
jgi:hypothetical protein